MPKTTKQTTNNNDGPKKIQLTQEGLEELKAELADLKDVKLPAVVKRVAIAREHGDLGENAEYSNVQLSIPFGGGIKYVINPKWYLAFELGIR